MVLNLHQTKFSFRPECAAPSKWELSEPEAPPIRPTHDNVQSKTSPLFNI